MSSDRFNFDRPPLPPGWFKQFRERLGVTQVELAAKLGVSFATVNRWENGQNSPSQLALSQIFTLDRNRSALSKSGTSSESETGQPSIALFTELDILYPQLSRYFPYAFRSLRKYFLAAGYQTRLYTGRKLPAGSARANDPCYAQLFRDAARGEVCGVVALHAAFRWEQDWAGQLAACGVSLVGDRPAFTHAVLFPHRQWISSAVRHLAAQGRKRFALASWLPGQAGATIVEAFRDEINRQGLNHRPEWIRRDLHPNKPGSGWAQFREIWTSHREKPDGLIITDDQLVPDVSAAINDLRVRVPDQLMLVAHANKGCPIRGPLPLTKLEFDTDASVRAIAKLMLKLVRGERVAEPQICGSDRFTLRELMPTPARPYVEIETG
jgi:DNA-binding LacI/PurR family transcriptional regulator